MRTYLITFFALCIFFNAVAGQSGCKKEDISLSQQATSFAGNGLPRWSVNIINVCPTQCSISQIHVSCGDFSSAEQVDPNIFRRLSSGDCLVNNGNPIKGGGSISFVYSQTNKYNLAVSSVKCA